MFKTILKGNLKTRQCKVLIRTCRAKKAASRKGIKPTEGVISINSTLQWLKSIDAKDYRKKDNFFTLIRYVSIPTVRCQFYGNS